MPASKVQSSKNQTVSIVEIECAINYWRQQYPSTRDTMTLCPQAASLAELYARMILFQMTETSWAEFSRQAKKSFQQAQKSFEITHNKAA